MANLKEIAEYVAVNQGFTKKSMETALVDAFGFIKDELANGQDVTITGFGKFVLKRRDDRQGRNPSTGKPVFIPSKNVVSFKPAKVLKDEVNS